MVKAHGRSLENLQPVLEEWDDEDNKLFQQCLLAACDKVLIVAKEYLHGGFLEIVPAELANIPAENLELERVFAKVKRTDTHSNHYSSSTVEGKIMWKENKVDRPGGVVLGEKFLALVREKAREMENQKQLDARLAVQKGEVWAVQDAEKKVLKENKRKRDENLEKDLEKLSVVTTKDQVMKLNVAELRLQLAHHKKNSSRPKLAISAPKKKILQDRLIQVLEEMSKISINLFGERKGKRNGESEAA
jgi:hypothetical protein